MYHYMRGDTHCGTHVVAFRPSENLSNAIWNATTALKINSIEKDLRCHEWDETSHDGEELDILMQTVSGRH